MSAKHEDRVLAILACARRGLTMNALRLAARLNRRAVYGAVASLTGAGIVERVPAPSGRGWRVCRLVGSGLELSRHLERSAPKPPPAKGRLRPAPCPAAPPPAPAPPKVAPSLPAVWRRRWGRLDGRRDLEVLVTIDGEYVYVTQWQNCGGTWVPRKGALRLKKSEATALHEALGVALEYAR